ncbi:MAG: acyl-CoA dehydrogenase family protein, partial [Bacteroidota bacterium]|nr:acyl-CoA dehydrogenase family protein [Bacteroidota bacterium]
IENGNSHHQAELKGVEEYAIECSILKVAVSENVQNCADEGIQVFGGMGFSEETPMEAAWRDARIARIYEGTNEINRMICIGMLIKKAMKGHVDLLGPAMKVKEELMCIPSFETPNYTAPLSQEKAVLKNLKKVFLMVAGAGIEKYGPQIEEQQQLLLNAADILIQIYMAESAILRTEKNIFRFGEADQRHQIEMSQLYLYNAVDIITKSAKNGIVSFVEGDEQRMMLMGLKRFTNYRNYPNVAALRGNIADKLNKENAYCF